VIILFISFLAAFFVLIPLGVDAVWTIQRRWDQYQIDCEHRSTELVRVRAEQQLQRLALHTNLQNQLVMLGKISQTALTGEVEAWENETKAVITPWENNLTH
jgi:hypothetical protein